MLGIVYFGVWRIWRHPGGPAAINRLSRDIGGEGSWLLGRCSIRLVGSLARLSRDRIPSRMKTQSGIEAVPGGFNYRNTLIKDEKKNY